VSYCSEECQKKNWKEHKLLCKDLKEYKAKVSRTKQELEKYSRKNLQNKTKPEKLYYEIETEGNIPIIYTTMSLEEVITFYRNYKFGLGGSILELMGCTFQKSIINDELLCRRLVEEVCHKYVDCKDPKVFELTSQLEWFIQNVNNCAEFFGQDSIYQEACVTFISCLMTKNEELEDNIISTDAVFEVLFRIYKKMENPATYLDGISGQFICAFLKTSKKEKVVSYFREVLENYQDYEICLVTEVVKFVTMNKMKELMDLSVKAKVDSVNWYRLSLVGLDK
jgi:hypothetical protein